MEKKCKKVKWLSGEALQIAVKRREAKSKGGKERYKHLNAEFQRIERRNKKTFPGDQCKGISQIGISELKWTGMGEFNSDDHYIYYYGPESLRRNGVATMVNRSV